MGYDRYRPLGGYVGFSVVFLGLTLASVLRPVAPAAGQSLLSRSQPGPQVGVQVVQQGGALPADGHFRLGIILDIPDGWHLYPNPPKGASDLGIPTKIRPEPSDQIEFIAISYPPGREYQDKLLEETYDIYKGRVVLYLEGRITAMNEASVPETLDLSGLLCAEASGTCLPWNQQTSFEIAAASPVASPSDEEIFAKSLDNYYRVELTHNVMEMLPNRSSGGADVVMPDYQPREYAGEGLRAGDWLTALLLALAAGAILNLMPCVLPVIPLKVLSLIQQAQADRQSGRTGKAVRLALVFSLGILAVFVALAVAMSGFKLLYGQQFQSLTFKFVMLMIIFVLALSMLGLFEVILPSRVSNIRVVQEGYAGAFGMGVLATLLATPCSAPLLGPVLTWSLSRPMPVVVTVFLVIGIGMAAPYILLTAFPGLIGRIPKAGPWMLRMKQGLGFVMLGVAAYLIFLFPAHWHLPLLLFCLIVALAIWLSWQVVGPNSASLRKGIARFIAVAMVAGGGWWLIHLNGQAQAMENPGSEQVENWLVGELVPLHEQGRTVMVEFTADWCPNCKYVEHTVLKNQAFKDKLKTTNTELIVADWTQNDPAITALLEKLGSKSIPFTAVFGGDDPYRPIVLRDIYSLNSILDVLEPAN